MSSELERQPQNDKERAKAKRILKEYGWTWAMYWALGVKQGWKCAICGRSAKNSALNGELDGLNIDHRHPKITVERMRVTNDAIYVPPGVAGWLACSDIPSTGIRWAKTKTEAIRLAKEEALPKSVRGLLCPGRHGKAGHGCCNRLLGRVDNPEWLEKARNYLLDPPAKSVL